MKRHAFVSLLAAVLLGGLTGCRPTAAPAPPPDPLAQGKTAYPLTVTDDLKTAITVDREPQRLVSLAPSMTEILFALGLGDRVVGVTTFCTYPPEAQQKTKIGGYVNSSEEKIVSLAPDLVFCTRGTPTTFISGLRAAGLKVVAFDEVSMADITRAIRTIGTLCNVVPAANKVAGELDGTLAELKGRTVRLGGPLRPRGLFVVWLDPLFVAGPGSFHDDILTACGVQNVAGLTKPYANLSPEAAIAADPQVLIMTSEHAGSKLSPATVLQRLRGDVVWKNVTAVKNGRVIVIDAGHIAVPGPRLVTGMWEVARAVHPELYADKAGQ